MLEPEGIPASDMTPEQQALLLHLVREWVGIVNDEAAATKMSEIESGLAENCFAWSGPITNGSPSTTA